MGLKRRFASIRNNSSPPWLAWWLGGGVAGWLGGWGLAGWLVAGGMVAGWWHGGTVAWWHGGWLVAWWHGGWWHGGWSSAIGFDCARHRDHYRDVIRTEGTIATSMRVDGRISSSSDSGSDDDVTSV